MFNANNNNNNNQNTNPINSNVILQTLKRRATKPTVALDKVVN